MAKKGTQPYVYTCSQHQHRLNIFGWVDPVNGRHGIMQWIRGNTIGFMKVLTQIVHRFSGKIIDL